MGAQNINDPVSAIQWKTIEQVFKEETEQQLPFMVKSRGNKIIKILGKTTTGHWLGENLDGFPSLPELGREPEWTRWLPNSNNKKYELRQHFESDSVGNVKPTGFVSWNEVK